MLKKLSQFDKYFVITFFIGLVIRLIVIPFSETDEADAVTRILITQRWLLNPEIISYGVWGPLHTYLIAFSLMVWDNQIYSPVVLHALFSAATAIPIYLFVKREWNETSALFVACLYLVYPVAFRYGLVALAEVPFIFFIAFCLLFLSHARSENGTLTHAALAGISLTLAGALRYEAWFLIPFLGLILWGKWKNVFVFGFMASIFPVFWLAGNYLHSGDPFYSFNFTLNWNLNISQGNADMSTTEIIKRIIFYPRGLFFGLTPLPFLVCVLGIYYVISHRGKQWVWLIPLAVLLGVFTINAITGSLSTILRYSLGLAIYMIPFAAEWFDRVQNHSRRLLFSIIIIISMIPFAYIRFIIPWPEDLPNPFPNQISYIPNVEEKSIRISEYVNEQIKLHPSGLLLDFSDWKETYHIVLMSQKQREDIYMTPGEVNEPFIPSEVDEFLDKNPTGVALVTENSRFIKIESINDREILTFVGYDRILYLEELGEVENNTLYIYSVNPP